jgi:hypothetical protein
MFLLDDVLLAPIKGVFWIFREVHDAAQKELASEKEAITTALSELYMRLETGQISEAEFDVREKELLDRLDRLEEAEPPVVQPKEKPATRLLKGKRPRKKSPPGVQPPLIL